MTSFKVVLELTVGTLDNREFGILIFFCGHLTVKWAKQWITMCVSIKSGFQNDGFGIWELEIFSETHAKRKRVHISLSKSVTNYKIDFLFFRKFTSSLSFRVSRRTS